MRYRVVADDLFWNAVNAIQDDPVLLGEVYERLWQLQEHGPELPGARENMWPLGEVLVPGWSIDLESGRAFIAYVAGTRGIDSIYCTALVFYDD